MSIPHELRTHRVLLRPWCAEDAVRLEPILIRDVPHLEPWIPAGVAAPASLPDLAMRLAGFAADFAASRAWRFALLNAAGDELLGEIDLFPRNASGRVTLAEADRAEVGYWLRSDRTGEGLAAEGVRAVIGAARELRQFAHVEIRCDARNVPSAALPARLGFSLAPGDKRDAQSGADADELEVWTLPLVKSSGTLRSLAAERAARHLR